MSNGVEVIIAGDKGKPTDNVNEFDQRITPSQVKRPMTLAPSTLKNQMILLMPSNMQENLTIPVSSNQFVTKTCLTTYTYRTTYLQDGKTNIESREKVVANIATEERNNYPKIKPSPSMGITLTRTPQLAVGVFPTTYSYFYTLYESDSPLVITSQHTILNTITAPDDYILFLQPSEAALPVIDTNTYYNRVLISKTVYDADVQKIVTRPETLTQVIVTESLPPRSTSVLTSYYALDIDETRTELPEATNILDNDLHIYATKTFLTTFTYFTTTTGIQNFKNSNNELTTNIKYHTKVIENVITESIPSTLIRPELLSKFRTELKWGMNQRRVIITTATLLGGQTLEITAMNILRPSSSENINVKSQTNSIFHKTSEASKIDSQKKNENENQYSNTTTTTTTSISVQNVTALKVEDSKLEEDSGVSSSEQAAVYFAAPAPTTSTSTTLKPNEVKFQDMKTKLKNPSETSNPPNSIASMNNILNSWNLNSLTALRPVINAVAGLLQSKLTSNSAATLKNTSSYSTNTESPIYIPVKNAPSDQNQLAGGLTSLDEDFIDMSRVAPPQSLHIEPPQADYAISDDNWMQKSTSAQNKIQAISLVNGGIPIRPGEVITANSDVIVGKPNGIEQPQIYTLQSQQQQQHTQNAQNIKNNNIIPLKHTTVPTSISYYQHIIHHPYRDSPHNHQHKNFKNQNGFSSFKKPIENYDDILKPPPITPHRLRFPSNIQNQALPSISTINAPSLNWVHKAPWSTDTIALQPNHMQVSNLFSLNNELKGNEVIEIKRVPQIYSTDLPPMTTTDVKTADTNIQHLSEPFLSKVKLDYTNLTPENPYQYQNKLGEPVTAKASIEENSLKETHQLNTIKKKMNSDQRIMLSNRSPTQHIEIEKSKKNPSHQQINLKNYVLNHNVAMNAPPLTFKKELEYPLATSIHGVPSKIGPMDMPHVKIPPNEKQVQVNLTPQHTIANMFVLPQITPKAPSATNSYAHLSNIKNELNEMNDEIIHQQNVRFSSNRKATLTENERKKTNVQHIPIGAFTYADKIHSQATNVHIKNESNTSFGNSWTSLSDEDNDDAVPTITDTVDQIAASSLSKNKLQVSNQATTSAGFSNNIFNSPTVKSNKTQLPMLMPFTALQVNYMDEAFHSTNKFSSLSHFKPTKSLVNTQKNESSKLLKFDFMKKPTSMPSTSTTLRHYMKNSVKPIMPFSSGSPFTSVHKTRPTWHSSNNFESTKQVFVAAGEVFKLPTEPQDSFRDSLTTNLLTNRHEMLLPQETKHFSTNTGSNTQILNMLPQSQFQNISANLVSTKNNLMSSTSIFSNQYVLGLSPPPLQTPSIKPQQISLLTTKTHHYHMPHKPSRNLIPPPTLPFSPIGIPQSHASLVKQAASNRSITIAEQNLTNGGTNSITSSTPFAISTSIQFSNSFKYNVQENSTTYIQSSKVIKVSDSPSKAPSLFNPKQDRTDASPGSFILEPSIESISSAISTEEFQAPKTTIGSFKLDNSKNPSIASKTTKVLKLSKTNEKTIRNKVENLNQQTRLILPTKYITNTVTTTKTSLFTTTAYTTQKINHNNKDKENSYRLKTTTYFLTKTLTATILDTITEIHTFVQPTRVTESHIIVATKTTTTATEAETETETEPEPETETETKTTTTASDVEPIKQILQASSVGNDWPENSIGYGTVIDYKINDKEIGHFESASDHYNITMMNVDQSSKAHNFETSNIDNNNIFIVMTNKQSGGNAAIDISNVLGDTTGNTIGDIELDYDDSINFEIPTRDEQFFADIDSKGKVNNVLLSGVLIATPGKEPNESLIDSSNDASHALTCQPACKSSRNEVCKSLHSQNRCVCRSGFARMFPDRPCKPTYTYTMKVQAHHIANYQLEYNSQLADNSSKDFRHLAAIARDAIDRMVMQSDFRDIYHGVHLVSFSKEEQQESGITANLLLQLSDASEEKRLEGVFKKYLRLSNFSIGGTELYTNKEGSEALSIQDFDECSSSNFNDCSPNSRCFNLEGTYTCSCFEGYIDQSENPVYPGRLCSTEMVGCEQCHYHGQCVITENLKSPSVSKTIICDCFAWYSGSSCQLNLKILLIALIGVGTFLFIVLLICVLLTCTSKRSEPRRAAFFKIQHLKPKTSSLISVKISPKRDRKLKTGLLKSSKINDKHAMIKDTSSESSQSSFPYVLKESVQNARKQRSVRTKNDVHFPKSIASSVTQNDSNEIKGSSQSVFLPTFAPYQHAILTEIEQSDRSLTVMIPRAKYHPSVLPEAKLVHHQLTMERKTKSVNELKPSKGLQTRGAMQPAPENYQHKNEGALVSAGFEVSAIVSKSVLNTQTNNEDPIIGDMNSSSDLSHQNAILIEESDKTTSRENASESHNSEYNIYKADDNFIDTMDEWLDSMQQKQLSAEARSFDETTIRAATKLIKSNCDNRTLGANEEANTMAERDIGSTFLLPHTHLYKPERESEISGLESF